ncbi:MAG: nucleotidyltransferase family protein [Anaerolineales bacterium]|nr:nucleotidyltransferase family protein [Anaerolineales bacterium]
MDQKEVLATLKKLKSALDEFGVRSIALFGSFAREEAKDSSDIDILVEFDRPVGLFEFARLKLYLEKKLGREVDLVTPDALREEMRDDILREAVHVA